MGKKVKKESERVRRKRRVMEISVSSGAIFSPSWDDDIGGSAV